VAHQKGNEKRLESGQEMLKQIFSKAKISPVGPVRTKEDDTRRNGDTLKYQKMKIELHHKHFNRQWPKMSTHEMVLININLDSHGRSMTWTYGWSQTKTSFDPIPSSMDHIS